MTRVVRSLSTRERFRTYLERISVFCNLALFPIVMEGIQKDELQVIVNGLYVFKSVGLEILENAVQTLWILNNL